MKRLFEIIPAILSWTILFFFGVTFLFSPIFTALILAIYLMYWACRLFYMTSLLILGHLRMNFREKCDWLAMAKNLSADIDFEDVIHVVLYPIYKEPITVVESSLESLASINYKKSKIIVVLAIEAREAGVEEKFKPVLNKYRGFFKDLFTVVHPDGIKGELPSKGSNATYAAKYVNEYFKEKDILNKNVVISCFDVDTCPDKEYFSCLTYHFLSNPKRYQCSYQPLPIYNNNIFDAPAMARVIEMGSTFWQHIESMRYGKFITFSSHSMSFKTLVDVNYWPVDMVSDDSVIYWKCFLYFNGDYETYPLERPVFMDIAVGKNILDTFKMQYKQKKRWAWGVENFVYIALDFMGNKNISFMTKAAKIYQLLDNHVNWATWSIIVSLITPLIMTWAKVTNQDSLIFLNLTYINNVISGALLVVLALSILISKYFIPKRPVTVSRKVYIGFVLQWLLLPFISVLLGSFPALDAQTCLLLGRQLEFKRTKKHRSVECNYNSRENYGI